MKKGTDKYKGVLPLKCFICGKIGHLTTKCLERGSRKKFKKINKKAYYVNENVVILDDESNHEDLFFLVEKEEPRFDISNISLKSYDSTKLHYLLKK